MKKSICLLVFIPLVFGLEESKDDDSTFSLAYVHTSNGLIFGTINSTINGNYTYFKFSGIPYAKAPVGDLRFKPPEAPEPWTFDEALFATKERSQCVQMLNNTIIGSEDCLYLNVYSRSIRTEKPVAVMVWIPGGGFNTLSGNYEIYGPDYLLEKNVVVVTLNYRLGVLGWLSTGDKVAPGNYALKDVLLALQWIKRNIRNFGGNPNQITLFGNSAGSAMVSYLVQSKKTKGLIHRAVMESATSLCSWTLTRNPQNITKLLAAQLNIKQDIQNNTTDLIKKLKEIDARSIVVAQEIVKAQVEVKNFLAGLAFGPVIEPLDHSAIVTESSYKLLTKGDFNKIPIIIGFNSNEMGNFFPDEVWQAILKNLDDHPEYLTPHDLTSDSVKKAQASQVIRKKYFDSGALTFQLQNGIKFGNIDQFIRPIRKTVELMSKHVDVFFYEFAHVGNARIPLDNRTYWGVAHGEDLYYLFNPLNPSKNFDFEVRQTLELYWTNFAKFGSDFNKKGLPKWRHAKNQLDKNDKHIYYLKMGQWTNPGDNNKSFVNEKNPNQTDWKFYQDIYKSYGDGKYDTY